jgi:hypothetical protein
MERNTHLNQNYSSLSVRDACEPEYSQGEDHHEHIHDKISSPKKHPPTMRPPVYENPRFQMIVQLMVRVTSRLSFKLFG